MRRCGTALLVLITVVTVIVGAPGAAGSGWQPASARARTYAESRSGLVSFAVVNPNGRLSGYRMRTPVAAASVIKVMFLAAYLRQGSVRHRALRESDRDLLRPMIIRSDNYAASRIADAVGPRAMYRLAERAGMLDFSYTRPWGNSRTSARDQARLMFRLPRYLPDRHRAYALDLLTRIVESQRWGIGEVPTPGWRKHFKGGWGSGTGSIDHQVVRLVDRRRRQIGLAVMTTSSPSHNYGKATLRGVFDRLLTNLP